MRCKLEAEHESSVNNDNVKMIILLFNDLQTQMRMITINLRSKTRFTK